MKRTLEFVIALAALAVLAAPATAQDTPTDPPATTGATEKAEQDKVEGAKMDNAWGSQIRSYVLQPYRMVKDHRTGETIGDADSVLDGGIDPFIEAWLKCHPDRRGARLLLDTLTLHLDEACIGSVSEIFDAEEPYTPRGCVAQAWSVAEVLRCLVNTRE